MVSPIVLRIDKRSGRGALHLGTFNHNFGSCKFPTFKRGDAKKFQSLFSHFVDPPLSLINDFSLTCCWNRHGGSRVSGIYFDFQKDMLSINKSLKQ